MEIAMDLSIVNCNFRFNHFTLKPNKLNWFGILFFVCYRQFSPNKFGVNATSTHRRLMEIDEVYSFRSLFEANNEKFRNFCAWKHLSISIKVNFKLHHITSNTHRYIYTNTLFIRRKTLQLTGNLMLLAHNACNCE